MGIYFDNGATTRVFPEVREIMNKVMDEDYGNPSSMHQKGVDAEQYLKDTREIIAKTMKVDPREIYFTSGGTESNNTALIGTALANRRKGKHIITSSIEHASVYNPLFFLEEMGFEVTFLPVDHEGKISLNELRQAIRKDTILVSIMGVNNEIGSVEPMEQIGKLIKECNPDTLYHVDAVQTYGKYYIYPKRWKIDMLSVSAHKIHGPKGIGFLYINKGTKIKPYLYGGNQEAGMRSGTQNVPAIAGMGVAVSKMYENQKEKMEYVNSLKQYFIEKVTKISDTKNNSGEAPHVASISFLGVRSEVLLHSLEDRGIYVSAGSACSSNKPAVSGTLKGIGLKKEEYESTLRFTFSIYNTTDEIEEAVKVLEELLPMLRRYVRR